MQTAIMSLTHLRLCPAAELKYYHCKYNTNGSGDGWGG